MTLSHLYLYHYWITASHTPFFKDSFIDIIDNSSLLYLFHHAMLPMPHVRSDLLSKIHTVSISILHCDEPLTRVNNFTSDCENIINKVWIFAKCGKEVTDAPQNFRITYLMLADAIIHMLIG